MKFVRYRIVTDNYAGYEVQVWRLWFPFWVQHNWVNTHCSVERAERYVKNLERFKKVVVKNIDL